MDSSVGQLSTPPATLQDAYRPFVAGVTTPAETVLGPPSTPDTGPALVLSAAHVLHTLVEAHPRWCLNVLMVRTVVGACKAVCQPWDVVRSTSGIGH